MVTSPGFWLKTVLRRDLGKGKYFVAILSTSCAHCEEEARRLSKIPRFFPDFPPIVGLCLGEEETLSQFRERGEIEFPTVIENRKRDQIDDQYILMLQSLLTDEQFRSLPGAERWLNRRNNKARAAERPTKPNAGRRSPRSTPNDDLGRKRTRAERAREAGTLPDRGGGGNRR